MKLDFFELYQNYSAIDLLKIVKRPDDYQSQAVDAAIQILKQRVVTAEDEYEVHRYYADIDHKDAQQKEKIQAYKNSVTEFVEPITHPKETVEPGKFVNILLLLIALQYAWWFYNQTRRFIRIFQQSLPPFDFLFYFQFINVFYVPLVFFLVFKRKKWGWILLFADSLFTLILRLSQIRFVTEGYFNGFWYVYGVFIRLLFLFVLWRPMIAAHFRVTVKVKKQTFFIVTMIALLFIAGVYVVYD